MKQMKQTVVWVLAMALLVPAGQVWAREDTGKVLTSLVNSVDQKLKTLEDGMEEQTQNRKKQQTQLKELSGAYKTMTNEMDRIDAESGIIGSLAELNLVDRRQVNSTLNTIVSVVGDLDKIHEVLARSGHTPEQLKRQRVRMVKAIQGVVPIMESLKGLDNPRAQAQLASTKATVVMLVKQLRMVGGSSNGFLKQIDDTTSTLEDVAVQLKIVKDLLEMEREVLTVASHTQLAKLVMGRLSYSLSGKHQVAGVAGKLQDGVLSRMEEFGRIWTEPNGGALALGGLSDSDENIWQDLVNGKIPELEQ